jgi:hypothetical protein
MYTYKSAKKLKNLEIFRMSLPRELIYPGKHGVLTRRNIFLPVTLVEELKLIAGKSRISYAELVRQVLLKHVKQSKNRENR